MYINKIIVAVKNIAIDIPGLLCQKSIDCNKLKNKLEQFKIDSSYDIQQIEINFDFFSTSIEQSKLVLFDDFLKNKKRYDYQLQIRRRKYEIIGYGS